MRVFDGSFLGGVLGDEGVQQVRFPYFLVPRPVGLLASGGLVVELVFGEVFSFVGEGCFLV